MSKQSPKAPRQRHKGRPGRPSKYTPGTVRKICDAVADGLPFKYAAALGGISHETFAEWRRQFPAFSERIRGAVARGILSRLRLIKRAADKRDVTCAKWWLEHVMPEHYSKTRLEASGPEGRATNEVQFNIGVTADELEATSGRDDPVRIYLPAKQPVSAPNLSNARLRQLIALCELPDGGMIMKKGGAFITLPAKEPIDVEGFAKVGRQLFGIPATPNKGNGADGEPAPAVPAALALPTPTLAPATPTPAPPPPERPAARSITETDLLGTEAEKREQAEIRAAPFRRPLNHNRRNPFLG